MKLDRNIAASQEALPASAGDAGDKRPSVAAASRRGSRVATSASACRTGAAVTPRRRTLVATRSIFAPANIPTAALARFLSTCTRKEPPSGR